MGRNRLEHGSLQVAHWNTASLSVVLEINPGVQRAYPLIAVTSDSINQLYASSSFIVHI